MEDVIMQPYESREKLLSDIQKYNFTLYDLALYMDTHPTEKSALDMYRDINTKLNSLMEEYKNTYGPMNITENLSENSWTWINSPWPWEE